MNNFNLLAAKVNQLATSVVMKEGDDITTKVNNLLTEGDGSILGILQSIGTKVGILVIVVAGLMWMFSPSTKGADAAKKCFFAAIFGVALLYLAPVIIGTLTKILGVQ